MTEITKGDAVATASAAGFDVFASNIAVRHLANHVAKRTPCMLWGAPGIGKSDMAAQVAKALDFHLIDLRLPLMESVDLRGLPMISNGVMTFAPPSELAATTQRKSLILWDEINAAPMSVQVASYQAILNNRIGEFEFGPETVHVCAGNNAADKAGAQRMSSALCNRMAHISVEPDYKGWSVWAGNAEINPLIIGYINYRPEALHKQPKEEVKAFPSPRSWAMANRYVTDAPDMRRECISQVIGDGAGGEFEAFCRLVSSLAHPRDIVANPEGAPIPSSENISGLYGVCSQLAFFIDRTNAAAAAVYVKRLPDEFHALFATLVTQRDPKIAQAAFAKFATAKGGMI